jgi:hypothetical protein
MDSETKETLIGIMGYIRRLETSALESARRYNAILKTIEEVIPGSSSAYTRHYEQSVKTLHASPSLETIEQTIVKLRGM